MSYYVGLDLGQSQDFTAISVVQRVAEPTGGGLVFGPDGALVPETRRALHLRHLERPQLGTPYPVIVDRVRALHAALRLDSRVHLVVDATGVGAPVVDMFRAARLRPISIHIHGGDAVASEGDDHRVPKRDLAGTLQALLQTGRLKVAAGLPLGEVFVRELLAFKVKVNIATGHDSYEALREGDHDDLVLSVALGCWFALRPEQGMHLGQTPLFAF